MTDERDFDRLARAWLELGPDRAPERSVAAVLQAVEITPQVWPWSRWLPGRDIQMTRLPILATAVATLVIVIGGGFMLSRGTDPGVSAPSASPSPTPSPSASVGSVPPPPEVVGGWVAPSRGTPVEDPTITTIVLGGSSVDDSAPAFSIDRPGNPRELGALGSNLSEAEPGVLQFSLNTPGGGSGCQVRDEGTYRWSVSADGQWLTLDLIEDACQVRGVILAGTWQRNIGFRNNGGKGVATAFTPYLALDLPAKAFPGSEYSLIDTVSIESDDIGLKIWKDLEGFADPCDLTKGRLALAPGIDGFLAYLNEDPRFTVLSQEDMTIDGRPAVKVEFKIGDTIKAPCWNFDGNPDDRTGVLTWVPKAETNPDFFWNAPIGSDDTLFVTEANGATLVFEGWAIKNGKEVIDQSLVDTVQILDALPTAP